MQTTFSSVSKESFEGSGRWVGGENGERLVGRAAHPHSARVERCTELIQQTAFCRSPTNSHPRFYTIVPQHYYYKN